MAVLHPLEPSRLFRTELEQVPEVFAALGRDASGGGTQHTASVWLNLRDMPLIVLHHRKTSVLLELIFRHHGQESHRDIRAQSE